MKSKCAVVTYLNAFILHLELIKTREYPLGLPTGWVPVDCTTDGSWMRTNMGSNSKSEPTTTGCYLVIGSGLRQTYIASRGRLGVCVMQSHLAAVSSGEASRKTGKVSDITIVLSSSVVLTKMGCWSKRGGHFWDVPNCSHAADTC
jgi:hypothetical protein